MKVRLTCPEGKEGGKTSPDLSRRFLKRKNGVASTARSWGRGFRDGGEGRRSRQYRQFLKKLGAMVNIMSPIASGEKEMPAPKKQQTRMMVPTGKEKKGGSLNVAGREPTRNPL